MTLTTFSDLPLGGLLISIALSSNDPSNVAVLQSLLALSSLYRYGYQMQAAKLKVATLQSLRASTISTGKDIIIVEAVKHVAAGMLLCSFEVRYQVLHILGHVLSLRKDSAAAGRVEPLGLVCFRCEGYSESAFHHTISRSPDG